MNERPQSTRGEKCTSCPNRGHLSKVLAQIAGKQELANDCEGPVEVSHGTIITQIRTGREPSPPQNTWTSMSGNVGHDGERRYSRNDWTSENVCGRESIEPHESEVPYDSSKELIFIGKDGRRYAGFISGSEKDIATHRGSLAIMQLIDTSIELEDARNTGNTQKADEATAKIASQGFTLEVSASRNNQ